MQQHQVLELIETVVRPLRQKIDHLEKQNQKLKVQLDTVLNTNTDKRIRSISKDRKYLIKKEQIKNVVQIKDKKSPSIKKKEQNRPIWGVGKPVIKNQHNTMKSPPTDKGRIALKSPRGSATVTAAIKPITQQIKSQQSSEGMKDISSKKIMGGKKVQQQIKSNNAVNLLKQQQKKSTSQQQIALNNQNHQINDQEQQYINNQQEFINNQEQLEQNDFNKSQKSANSYNKSRQNHVY